MVRIGLLSDCEGNATALERILVALRAYAPDLIVHAGDILCVPFSPDPPAATIALLRAHGVLAIPDNHDRYLLDWGTPRWPQTPWLRRCRADPVGPWLDDVAAGQAQIRPDGLAWLRALPTDAQRRRRRATSPPGATARTHAFRSGDSRRTFCRRAGYNPPGLPRGGGRMILGKPAVPIAEEVLRLAPACPEQRRLLHGDFGYDNVLTDGERITGVIDWANAGYGDYLYDVAWVGFWPVGRDLTDELHRRYGSAPDAALYNERITCYQCLIGLGALKFFAELGREQPNGWVKERLRDILAARTAAC